MMKHKALKVAMITLLAMSGFAHAAEQSDPHEARQNTVSQKTVKFVCQNNKKLSVTFGFNQQKLPTYAQAYLNGKTRFMPINLNRSDNVSTVFGDENNFSLMAGEITKANVHKANFNVQSPAGEILYKGCRPTKR